MGFVSYLMFLIPLGYAVDQGWIRFGYAGLAVFTLVAMVANVGFLTAIRSGYSTRFRDPTLVIPQILVAVFLALVMSYYADEAGAVTLMLFFAAFFFGVFSLTTRQYFAITAVTSLGYAAMLAIKFPAGTRGSEVFRVEILDFLMLVVILCWMSLLCSYVARMRRVLSKRKDALGKALERLQELASHDDLTGVYNRRYLMEILSQQQERTQRYGERLSICLLDLDHFKRINDTHGHGVGDEALQAFASHARLQARKMDAFGRTGEEDGGITDPQAGSAQVDGTFGRYGGEEFLLLLPHTDQRGALIFAERLRGTLHASPLQTSAGPVPIRFSAGVAELQAGETIAHLLNRADKALYQAKKSGRDRIQLAPAT